MLITDKQGLRQCLKQLLRNLPVVETGLAFDLMRGDVGLDALMSTCIAGSGTSLSEDYRATVAAREAMGLPSDIEQAKREASVYTREAWMREIADQMKARRILVVTTLDAAVRMISEDDRYQPLPRVNRESFVPGRYGVDYARCSQDLAERLSGLGVHEMLADTEDLQTLRYGILPMAEDHEVTLHLEIRGRENARECAALLPEFTGVRAVLFPDVQALPEIMSICRGRERLLLCAPGARQIPELIDSLGLHFLPMRSMAVQPEQMLGRWSLMRDRLRELVYPAYLALARSGVQLSEERLEEELSEFLCPAILRQPG